MQNHEPQNQAPRFSLADIYYIPFRHKWKIILLSAAGFLAAVVFWITQPVTYTSEAKLFIRYVVDSRLPSGIAGDLQIKTPDPSGANIINSEIEIITSLDLARKVVNAMNSTGETNNQLTLKELLEGLTVHVLPHSDIVRIVFRHPNPKLVNPVLSQLIEEYQKLHVAIYRSMGGFDAVLETATMDSMKRLLATEMNLEILKTNAGVTSIEEAKKSNAEALSKTREHLFEVQEELVERQATIEAWQKLEPAKSEAQTAKGKVDVAVDKMEESKAVRTRLDALRTNVHEIDVSEDVVRTRALQAKTNLLTSRLEQLTVQARNLNALEPALTALQRQKDLEESKYRHFSTLLQQALFNGTLCAVKTPNISVIHEPTPPALVFRKSAKLFVIIFVAGVVGGIALAGLCEFKTRLGLKPVSQQPPLIR